MFRFIGKLICTTVGVGGVLGAGSILGICATAIVLGKGDEISEKLIEDSKEMYQALQNTKNKLKSEKDVKEYLDELLKKDTDENSEDKNDSDNKTDEVEKDEPFTPSEEYIEWLNKHKL